MPNFIVQALFLQALCTSPLRLVFKSWEKEWLLDRGSIWMPLQLLHFFIWSLQANAMPQYVLIELWEPIVSKWHFSSAILWQISDGQYFFAFDQTHTYLGGSVSNSISEVSPYNEVLANAFSDYQLVWTRTVCTKFAPCLFGSLLLGAALEASAIGRDMRELESVIRIAMPCTSWHLHIWWGLNSVFG